MSEAVLRVRTEGGAEVQALVDRLDRAIAASRGRRVRAARDSAAQEVAAYRGGANQILREEQLLTRAHVRRLALQGEAQRRFVQNYTEAHKRATTLIENEVGHRGQLTDREKRQVEALALTMVANHERAERRRTAATIAEERKRAAARRQFLQGAGTAVMDTATRVAGAFAEYGDDARAKQRARDQVELTATRIAASDIGDAGAAGQLSEATRRVSELTGLDPQGVIDAIGAAQANFSTLADAANRGTYLRDVLPMLAQAAASSGTSLTDMVNAAGEFQRQLGVTTEQLPTALAMAIQGGRLGSISFSDQARHMGVIGGGAARFLSSRPEDALQSLATTNALFQFAGRAGGGGDVSATRARAFLDNFTSARGQRGLHDALGYDVMGANGEIVTREGESQTQAFQRVIQDAYRRTGGNSTRFLDAIAGSNTRARALGDQLFRDMRAHGGTLTEFRDLVGQQMGGTVENAITRPFQAVRDTAANARARREVGDMYHLTGSAGNFATESERQTNEMMRAHPVLGRLAAGSTVFRGTLDAVNELGSTGAGNLGAPAGPVARGDRAGLMRATARDAALATVSRDYGPAELGAMGTADVQRIVEDRTAQELARLQLRDQALRSGANPSQVTISQESINDLARAIVNRPLVSDNTMIHYEMSARHGSREAD